MSSKRKLVGGSDDDIDSEESREETLDLERSIKELCLKKDDPQQADQAKKVELISKLGEARQEDADLERMARRMVWRREVRRKIATNAEFKEFMEAVPLEDVEGDQKAMMTRMSMEWREAFKSERAGLLFPQVLAECLNSSSHQASPDILEHRLVSKSVKESIEKFPSGKLQFLRKPDGVEQVICDNYRPGIRVVKNLDEVFTLAKRVGQDLDPFFFRHIVIRDSGRSHFPFPSFRQDGFWGKVERILSRWGKGVWSASIEFNRVVAMSDQVQFDLLATYLALMPNLRSLTLTFEDLRVTRTTHAVELLHQSIATRHLPDMVHLRVFHVKGFASRLIIHALLSKTSSVLETVRLELDPEPGVRPLVVYRTVSNCPPPATLEGSFPALQELKLRYGDVMDTTVLVRIFNNLSSWGIPLKRLSLTLSSSNPYSPVEIDEGLLVTEGVCLDMPLLEKLDLVLCSINVKTLDFLHPCKALKELHFCYHRSHHHIKPRTSNPDDEILQFPDPSETDESSVYQSRIWKLLPELKLIHLKVVTTKHLNQSFVRTEDEKEYSRESYIQHRTQL